MNIGEGFLSSANGFRLSWEGGGTFNIFGM